MLKPTIIYFGIKDFPSRGGTSRVAENIIRNLSCEYEFIVYCYKHPQAAYNIPGVKVIQFPEIKIKGLGVFLYFFLSAFHILLFQKKRAIIHAHKTDCALFVPFLGLKHKVILTSHEAPYKRDKWGIIGRAYFKLMEFIFIKSGAVITSISKPLAEYYYKTYKREVVYIPNGIEIGTPRNKNDAESLLKRYKVNNNFILFAARRLMFSKGIHTYLSAVRNLTDQLDYIYAGEIYHASPKLIEILESMSATNIKHIGFIEELQVLLALVEKSKLFVFPSETEGMSIMLLEVVSTKTPVICSDIPENTSVFDETEVLYFKNKDASDLQNKIEWALTNPETMNQKAMLAFEKVKNVYSWNQISEHYKMMYNQKN